MNDADLHLFGGIIPTKIYDKHTSLVWNQDGITKIVCVFGKNKTANRNTNSYLSAHCVKSYFSFLPPMPNKQKQSM